MRKLSSVAGAALLAVTALATPATPASAQSAMAGGSCGNAAGAYGLTDVNSNEVNSAGETVPALFYTVNYSGVPAPTTVGVIVRYNGELESQQALATFTANNAGGTFDGALRANISPDAQGFANSINQARRGAADGPPDGNRGTRTQNSGTQGGLTPGEYVFYIYTGEVKDVWNVKDGVIGSRFVADEKGYLGTFSCGVSTSEGSGPG